MFYRYTKRFFSTLPTSIHTLLDKNSPITRIRIWRSGYFVTLDSGEKTFITSNVGKALVMPYVKQGTETNIGHVSIETKALYASLWPQGISILNKYKPQPGEADTSHPKIDELSETRPPDYLIDLHTLKVDKIKEALDKYMAAGSTYHLIGSNRFFKHFGANSCSGLAYDLLIAGEIKNLLPTTHFVRDYIVTTPNNLAQLVLEAHSNEKAVLDSTSSLRNK